MDLDREELDENGLSKEDWEMMEKGFEFRKAATQAREGKPPDTSIEFECPICKGKAVTGYASNNGHARGWCECGIGFMV